jgi:fluoroquinolone transport system permease protein
MKIFIKLLKWDFVLLVKYGILPVAIGIGLLYIALIHIFNLSPNIIIFLIFNDPTALGFIFVGVMVLFEKQSGTTSALVVTPLRPWQYLLSKSIILTIPAIFISVAMVFAAGATISYLYVIISVALTSVLFLLLGFIGAQRVKSFNQYILIIPIFIAPLSIPLVSFFRLLETPFMWIIPTHSTLVMLKAGIGEASFKEWLLGFFILSGSVFLVWKWAITEYKKRMADV